MIDICCVGSDVKYHTPSYWSTVMTSPVRFSTGVFRAKQVFPTRKQGLLDSLPRDLRSRCIKACVNSPCTFTSVELFSFCSSKLRY